ncbi:MAG TPA: ABC transporter ATP-binding protein [Candidatus Dormibacteraeota bacterium]|nr:ABC transporter ATP-binding protein [Candidatus Dormibacteraeota bacterium]
MKITIATKNVTKTYGKGEAALKALDNISLDIKAGESVAIIGKSGSGKSTLMHTLALLDKPSKGSVLVNGEDASRMSGRQLDTLRNKSYGFVFQQFFLNANDTVLNNVILPLKIAGVGRRERNKRAIEVLKAVELEDKAGSKAANLSGGQKQRVCIARALINNPSVIFADEPTGNLDSVTGKTVEDLLFKLNREQGITLVIVTHDKDIAARCGRQLHIKDGKLTGRGEI